MPHLPLPVFLRCALLVVLAACGGCGQDGDDYYPLAAGRWWYYTVDETILDEARSARYLVRNLAPREVGERRVVPQAVQTASVDFITRDEAGVVRVAQQRAGRPGVGVDDPPRLLLPATPEDGRRWQVPSTLGLIESRTFERADRVIMRRLPVTLTKHVADRDAEVVVPAGHFTHCLRIAGEGRASVPTDRGNAMAEVLVESSEWYAPGVGLVKVERRESSDSAFLKPGTQRLALAAWGD